VPLEFFIDIILPIAL